MKGRLSKALKRRVAVFLGKLLHSYEREIEIASLPRFPGNPKNLRIERPRRIFNPESIHFGNDVQIGPGSLLVAIAGYPVQGWVDASGHGSSRIYSSRIQIGDRVSATGNLTVSAASEVIIEDDVVIAGNVYIGDSQHGRDNPDIPYKYQDLTQVAPIVIGRGAWIGQNVAVMPGVRIGDMAVIGANSVVCEHVPARSIAVGAPARVVRMWDMDGRRWTA